MSPDGVQGQSPCERTCPPTGCRGRAPASIHTKTSFNRRARRAGGAAAAPAGRRLPKEARAARSLGKAKTWCRRYALNPSFSQTNCHHNPIRGFGGRVPRRGAGAEPLHQFIPKLLSTAERGERAAQPPRPQGAGFRRKREPRGAWARQKSDISAMRSNGGSGDVSPDGMQGRSPCERTCPPTGLQGQSPCERWNAYKVSSPPASNLL